MLAKFALFVKMYVFHHFFYIIIIITFAFSASLASFALKTEFTILNIHIYFCMF